MKAIRTVLIAALAAASPMMAIAQEKTLVIATYGGVLEKAWRDNFFAPFEQKTGIKVRVAAVPSPNDAWARAKSMLQSGNVEWDIISGDISDLTARRDMLQPIDCSKVPTAASEGVPGTCVEYGVRAAMGGLVIAWNPTEVTQAPRSWADFWDVKAFPGRRALAANLPEAVIPAALMADGVKPDELFPLDLDRAFRKLDQLKGSVDVWWKTGDQSQQMFRSGEVNMAMAYTGRVAALNKAGIPVQMTWNQGLRTNDYWVVLKGAPNRQYAESFFDFYLGRPEAHAKYREQVTYETPNKNAFLLLDEAGKASSVTNPENFRISVDVLGNPWFIANRDAIRTRWVDWLSKL